MAYPLIYAVRIFLSKINQLFFSKKHLGFEPSDLWQIDIYEKHQYPIILIIFIHFSSSSIINNNKKTSIFCFHLILSSFSFIFSIIFIIHHQPSSSKCMMMAFYLARSTLSKIFDVLA